MEGLRPLDAALNLPDEKYSLEVRRRAAEAIAKGSFEEAARMLRELAGAPVPKRQVEEMARRASEDFDAFYERRITSLDLLSPRETGELVILTIDQKGVVMRQEDLRPWTQKAA